MILKHFQHKIFQRNPKRVPENPRGNALITCIVNGQYGTAFEKVRIFQLSLFQVEWYKSCMPIIGMKNIRNPVQCTTDLQNCF